MTNPWAAPDPYAQAISQATGNINNAYAGMDQSQMALQGLQNQQSQMTEGYPAMSNAYGLGQQVDPMAGAASNPDYATNPITVPVPDTASRGFNPWSLTGEANARGN